MDLKNKNRGNRSNKRIVFDHLVTRGGKTDSEEIPFIIGVLADFSGTGVSERPKRNANFLDVGHDGLAGVFRAARPSLEVCVPNRLSQESTATALTLQLTFGSLEDFEPQRIVDRLVTLLDLGTTCSGANILRKTR